MYISKIRIDRKALAASGSYVKDLPFLRGLPDDTITLSPSVTFFTGENGSGKSSLLEAVAAAAGFNPEGGSRNFSFHTRESHSSLWESITLIRNPVGKWKDGYFLRAESYYNVASHIDELDEIPAVSPKILASYGGRSLHEMSHGESFMALLRDRLSGNGLYIFDEPEAALSPSRQLAMLGIIKKLADRRSQFIISTHSPILTAYPGALIYEITADGITERDWRMTDNYMITKRFLGNPEAFFAELFE